MIETMTGSLLFTYVLIKCTQFFIKIMRIKMTSAFKASITLQVRRKAESITVNEKRLTILSRDDAQLDGLLQMDSDLLVLLLSRGNAISVYATVEPESASNRRYELSTSDESIIRVSGTNVTPKAPGECILTISSQSNPEVSVAYHVFVVQRV